LGKLSISNVLKKGVTVIAIIVAITLLLATKSIVEFVDNTEYAIHQNAFNGKLTAWNTPGLHWQWFGKVVKFKKARDIYLSSDELDGGSGKDVQPVSVLFPDGNAKVDVVCRYELSLVDSIQMELYKKFGNAQAVHNMVRQQVIEAVKGVGPLMSSAEAYSDRKPEVAILARNMALNGIYASQVVVDTTYTKEDGDSTVVYTKRYDLKRNTKGQPIITKSSILKQYNIAIPVFNVKDMDFDNKTVKLIEARKDAQLAKQDAITAFQNGQARIAKERATQEVEKIKQVTIAEKEAEVARIAAEKEKAVAVTKAEKEKEVARLNAEKAKQEAIAIDRKSTAEAMANKRKVAAGLTPQERAQWNYKTKVDVAKAIADGIAQAKYPTVYSAGSGNGKGSNAGLIDYLGIEAALNIVDKTTKK